MSKEISQCLPNCYFGSYPTQTEVNEMEEKGFNLFVDLTNINDQNITSYKVKTRYTQYPIKDNFIPTQKTSFSTLLHFISDEIRKEGTKVYIHCRGGHGRSGVLVACLLVIIKKISPRDAIIETTKVHNLRKGIKTKWKLLGSPQTRLQRKFVITFFEPYIVKFHSFLHNQYTQLFHIPNFDFFISVNHAYRYFLQIIQCRNIKHLLQISSDSILETYKYNILYNIVYYKLKHNPFILTNLLHTGWKPFVYPSNSLMADILHEIRDKEFKSKVKKRFI